MSSPSHVHLVSEWPAAVAAGTDEARYVTNVYPFDIRIVAAYATAQATTAADATNYTTLTVEASDSSTTIASVDTTTAALTAATPRAMTITEGGSEQVIAQGEAFLVLKTDSGTGAAFEGAITLLCEPVRSA